jgi:hypothetical protein
MARIPDAVEGQTTPNVWQDSDGLWWHRDESEQAHGPFNSKDEAYEALDAYCRWLDGGPDAGTGQA